ncbi:MAG: cupin domain-containing protein [Bacteroidetes bacterium]|nr:cupin domain-containing protein [Bacteroidota bacterium]
MESLRVWFFLMHCVINTLALSQPMPSDTLYYTREKCITPFDASKIESTKAGYQFWFVDKNFLDGRTLKLSVVKPREATHAPHKHPEDEFFFLLEGTAEIYLFGKWTPVTPYTSIYCPPHEVHGIRNAGDTELKYLVIKKYPK